MNILFDTIYQTSIIITPPICHSIVHYLREKCGVGEVSSVVEGNMIMVRSGISLPERIGVGYSGRKVILERVEQRELNGEIEGRVKIESKMSYGYCRNPGRFETVVRWDGFVATKGKSREDILDHFRGYLSDKLGVVGIEDMRVMELSEERIREGFHLRGNFHISFSCVIEDSVKFMGRYLEGVGQFRSYGYGLIRTET